MLGWLIKDVLFVSRKILIARLNILFILLRLLLEVPNIAGQTITSASSGCLLSSSVKCLYVITFNLWIFRSYSG